MGFKKCHSDRQIIHFNNFIVRRQLITGLKIIKKIIYMSEQKSNCIKHGCNQTMHSIKSQLDRVFLNVYKFSSSKKFIPENDTRYFFNLFKCYLPNHRRTIFDRILENSALNLK
jgi:hypothetical protein